MPPSGPTSPPTAPRRVVVLLALVTLVGYALRTNIAVAQEYMAPDLGLSMADMGLISAWGFQLAYALFQVPGGFLGDRYGPRVILALSVLGWSVASFGAVFAGATGGAAFLTLFAMRALLGVTQAPTFPVAALAVAQHVPGDRRIASTAIYIASSTFGAGLAPLTLAPLMVAAGWRSVFIASGVVGLVMAIVWYALAPSDAHRAPSRLGQPLGQQFRDALGLLGNGQLMRLSISYFLHSAVFFVFVFWFFRYLTEGRGFSILASGAWGSMPYFAACVIGPFVGFAADRLSRSMPPMRARQRVAMMCLITAGTLVLVGANLPTPILAVAALSLSVSLISSAEAPYWTAAATIGAAKPGAAGGVLNLMGNLGGVFSIWLVPLMKDAWGWTAMLGFWAAVAVVAALLWLTVKVEPRLPESAA